jgi:hypothetical protein
MGEPEKPEKIEFATILESGPLYKRYGNVANIPKWQGNAGVTFPTVNLPCDCTSNPTTTWKLQDSIERSVAFDHFFVFLVQLTCVNCHKGRIEYVYMQENVRHLNMNGANKIELFITKIGQFPKLEVSIEKPLEKMIGKENAELLKKARMSRHVKHGIGALAYLRRVIENMLRTIGAKAIENHPDKRTEIEGALKLWRFEDKLEKLKTYLPDELNGSDGDNPFLTIYGKASEGIHGKSEEECVDTFDALNSYLGHLADDAENAQRRKSKAELLNKLKGKA